MKIKGILLALTVMFLFTSCGDDCEVTSLNEAVIGKWDINILGQSGSVEFLSDGTFLDPDDILLGGSINGVDLEDKSYEVLSEDQIELTISNGSNNLGTTYDVTSYDCDELVLSFIGIAVTLKKN